jgi:hypothetical protein
MVRLRESRLTVRLTEFTYKTSCNCKEVMLNCSDAPITARSTADQSTVWTGFSLNVELSTTE